MVGLLTCYWIPVTFPHLPGGYCRQTLIVGRSAAHGAVLIQRAKAERGVEIGPQIPIPLKIPTGEQGWRLLEKANFSSKSRKNQNSLPAGSSPLLSLSSFPPTHWNSLRLRDRPRRLFFSR